MFWVKRTMFGVVAILATLGAEDLVLGGPKVSPPVATGGTDSLFTQDLEMPHPDHYVAVLSNTVSQVAAAAPVGVSAAPPFRPLTAADAQDALAQVKTAAADLDQRFATAGTSADGWKEYLSWDQFKGELAKAQPDTTVLGKVYKRLASGYEGLELKWFANLRTALVNYLLVAGQVGNPDLEAAVKSQIDDLTKQLKSLSPHPTTEETRKIANLLVWLESTGKRRNWSARLAGGSRRPIFTPRLAANCSAWASAGPSMTWRRSTTSSWAP